MAMMILIDAERTRPDVGFISGNDARRGRRHAARSLCAGCGVR